MALVEPLVGHLLSQYTETVLEGLEKIRTNAIADADFAPAIANSGTAVDALKNTLVKQEKKPVVVAALQTICVLVAHCESQPGSRAHLLREFCRGDVFAFLRKAISALSDDTLLLCMAALQLLTLMAVHVPRILLARFNHKLPLSAACFRGQLPYSQRRLRAARLEFLLALTTSKFSAVSAAVVVEHGCLTQVFDDAAELLLEGTEQGLKLGRAALRMFEEQFVSSSVIPVAQKRTVLLAQRNVFRLFVKALEYPAVAGDAERLVYRMVAELIESPSDYATTRAESTDERGMPNYILFFLLRQLRPKNSALISRLVVFILHKAPDLIRPYFTRVSGHLPDEGNTSQRIAPATARVATLNVMTRILLAPIPYHLAARRITLEPIAARATTFYAMSPQAVVNEICPPWVAEYVHRLINGSTNLMMLTLAMQLTQAALERAQTVLALVAQVQETQQQQQQQQRRLQRQAANASTHTHAAGTHHSYLLDAEEIGGVDEDGHAVDWESFDAQVQAALLQAVPRREEFWHRMTQQLHPLLLTQQQQAFQAAQEASSQGNASRDSSSNSSLTRKATRVEFVTQRMLTLMRLYTDVFQLRVSWLSAVPVFVPTFAAATMASQGNGPRKSIIATALRLDNDVLSGWQPASVSALCALLVPSLMRGVSMTKLHHITMSSSAQGGVTEWPLLLSLLLWAIRARDSLNGAASATKEETANAVAWIARLVQWTVHSVTVRFGCEFEESLVWVLSLTPETVPCFLHLLNHLLQRSLSKVADRVAKELFEAEGDKGVLVAAAEAFLARTEEKKQQRAEAPVAPVVAAPAQGKKKGGAPANHNTNNSGGGGGAIDLWTEDLYQNVDGFRAVVQQVQSQWASRAGLTSTFCAVLQQRRHDEAANPLEGSHGQRRIALSATSVLADPQQHEALVPAHEQLLQFSRTLRAPVAMRSDEEIELLVAMTAQDGAMTAALARVGVVRWAAMHAVCWEAAGHLLRALNAVQSEPSEVTRASTVLDLATSVLAQITRGAVAVRASLLAEQNDGRSLAFHVLILTLVRVLLTIKKLHSSTLSAAMATLEEGKDGLAWVETLETLLLSTYQGSTSTVDRVRYATLLSLHYLTTAASTSAEEEAAAADVDENDDEGSETDSSASASSHSESDDDDDDDDGGEENENEEDAQEQAQGGGAGAAHPNHASGTRAAASKQRSHLHHARRLFAGALVPRAFTQHRYLISDHSPAEYITPEVDVLSLLVDAWTDDEVRTMALQTPVRLSNTILCGARRSEWDLVRSVFPEVACEEDLHVIAFARASAATVADPRFLFPLLQTVLALPPERVARTVTLGLRCLPLLLRGLSCTEASLRGLAATALSTLYIPSGPSRIVTTFARMKLMQLWQKQQSRGGPRRHGRGRPTGRRPHSAHQRHRRNAIADATAAAATAAAAVEAATMSRAVLPRLPTPMGSVLILAMRPLGDYGSPLHNHLIRFFMDTRNALGASVPFAQWLSSFPLEALSAPLMLKRHEELQKDGAQSSSIAQTSAAEVAAQMRRDMPPQLDFIVHLVSSACETNGDAMAMLRSECVQNTMLLADLVSASPELRLAFVGALAAMCSASYRVTLQLTVQARVLLWAVGFALQLCREFTGSPHRFGEPLFTAVLELIVTVSAVLGATPPQRHATLHGQAQELLRLLYRALIDAHVTAKQTLEMVEKALQAWQQHEGTTAGVKRSRTHEQEVLQQTEEVAEASPAKKLRRKK